MVDEMKIVPKASTALAFFIFAGFFLLVGLILLRPIPEESEKIATVLAGGLGSIAAMVASYYFGSSEREKAQDKESALVEKKD